jgi:hypothetical protein
MTVRRQWLGGAIVSFVLVMLAFTATVEAAAKKPPPAAEKEKLFTLTSPAMKDDAMLPLKYAGGTSTCGGGSAGKSISPPLAWTNAPPSTKSFALIMIDPDGRRGLGSVHWIAYNIPAASHALKEGAGNAEGKDVTAGKNSRGTNGYTGPCGPAVDAPHHYIIQLLALDIAGTLQPGLDRDELLNMINGHSLGPASLVVRYHAHPSK